MKAPPHDAEIVAALEEGLSRHAEKSRRIVSLKRRPFIYRSSFAIEELEVVCENGERLSMIFKDTSWEALSDESRRAKPRFLFHPAREIEVYRRLLRPHTLGTAKCYAAVADAAAGRYWLFLEKLSEVALYQTGDRAVWHEAARWLAKMHLHFREPARAPEFACDVPLLVYDREYYGGWIERACSFLSPETPAAQVTRLKFLAAHHGRMLEALAGLPLTFLHGEFYASNILVRSAGEQPQICPIDWEMAAVGPGLIDLAALIAGSWSPAEKIALARSYQTALSEHDAQASDSAALAHASGSAQFVTALDWCRLHLAVQWLGWSRDWTPPAAQQQNWLSEALGLMDRLGL